MTGSVARHRRRPDRSWGPAGLMLTDQALNSATNVAATLVVAHTLSERGFAVFATGQLVLALGQTVMLAAAGDRLLQATAERRAARYTAALGFYRVGVGFGALLAVAGLAWGAGAPFLFAVGALTAVAAVDYVRTSLFACGLVKTALLTDLGFGVVQLAALVGWAAAGAPGAAVGAWAVWMAAAVLTFAPYAARRVGAWPVVDPAPLREAVSLRYGGEMMLVNGSGQLAQLAATAGIGLGFNGLFRGVQIPFGIVVVVLLASRAVLIPWFARQAAWRRSLAVVLAAMVALCATCGIATAAVAARPDLRFLVAGRDPGLVFVVLTTLTYAGMSVQMVVFYLLRARHADRAVSLSRIVVVAGFALTAAVAALTRSPSVFLLGSALTWLVTAAAMVRLARERLAPTAPTAPIPSRTAALL